MATSGSIFLRALLDATSSAVLPSASRALGAAWAARRLRSTSPWPCRAASWRHGGEDVVPGGAIGKPWEKQGKTMGKPWENDEFIEMNNDFTLW